MDESRLERALGRTRMDWTLGFVGEGHHEKLQELNASLKKDYHPDGDGKHIDSGFAYWGARPSYEWSKACGDEIYRVMRDGIETFPERWSRLEEAAVLPHYVSLGIGTGEKDFAILSRLQRSSPDLYFFPVDMSSDLMRRGVLHVLRRLAVNGSSDGKLSRGHVLPVQIDFSLDQNLEQLRALLDEIVGDAPILFGLLGNTIANFHQEIDVLRALSALVRPGVDLLLLETASTRTISADTIQAAREEYAGSPVFRDFALSSLIQHTDLTVDKRHVVFTCTGSDTALKIDVLYRASSDSEFRLLGGDRVAFPIGDTIRLYISRKYTQRGLDELLAASGLRAIHTMPDAAPVRRGAGFGLTLSLCRFEDELLDRAGDVCRAEPAVSVAPARALSHVGPAKVFVSYSHRDRPWLEQLRQHLEPSLRNGDIELWDDTRLRPGDRWRDEIERALRSCQVAVLLVSQGFVSSEFIASNELPLLLKAAVDRGLRIIWVPISESSWRETGLAKLQATHEPRRPLDSLKRPTRQRALAEIAEEVRSVARGARP